MYTLLYMSIAGFRSVKDVAMYFHSSFRNVGLYTSLALAGMAAARSYMDSKIIYYLLLTIISIMLLLISVLLNGFLFARILELSRRFAGLNIWLLISGIMFILQTVLFVFGSILLYSHFV